MFRPTVKSFLLFVLTGLLLAGGCMPARERLPGYLSLRLKADPTSLDPALITDVTSGSIAAKLFNGLVKMDESLRIVPDLASGWTISDDRCTYVFRLRGDVTFPDGRGMTSQDILYSFERVLDPAVRSPNTWVFDRVAKMEAENDLTFKITLTKPFSPFLGLLTMPAAYVVDRHAVEALGPDFGAAPVGTGPFQLVQWLHNRMLRLSARKDYFDGSPKLKGITYRVIPEDLTAIAEFEIGNLDVIGIPSPEYRRFMDSSKWRPLVVSLKGLNTYYLGMNCLKYPFNNSKVRLALAYAIDRKKILETFYEGRGVPAAGPVPPALRSWPAPELVPFDPKLAVQLMREAGLPEGSEFSLYVTSEQETLDLAEIIQDYLAGIGLKINIRQLEWSAYKAAINRGEADLFWLSWWADYPDAENFLFPTFHSSNLGAGGNRTRYINDKLDGLIEAGRSSASDKSWKEYKKAEYLIADEAPWVFFWHRTDYAVRQPWVKGFRLYPIYTVDKGLVVETIPMHHAIDSGFGFEPGGG